MFTAIVAFLPLTVPTFEPSYLDMKGYIFMEEQNYTWNVPFEF